MAAARLGARVALSARIGNDARGDVILERLRDEGVDSRHVTPVVGAATGLATIQVGGDGAKQVLAFPGANSALARLDADDVVPTIERSKVLLVQLEATVPIVAKLAAIAGRAGCRMVLDAAPAHPLPDSLVERVFLLRANAEEARLITGVAVVDRRSARRAASMLLRRGAKAACIQAARAGDVLVWQSEHGRKEEAWLPRFVVDPVDSTGAGDAFSAALAVMVARHRDFAHAGRLASAAAALTTTKLGAQAAFPSLRAINAFLSTPRRASRAP